MIQVMNVVGTISSPRATTILFGEQRKMGESTKGDEISFTAFPSAKRNETLYIAIGGRKNWSQFVAASTNPLPFSWLTRAALSLVVAFV